MTSKEHCTNYRPEEVLRKSRVTKLMKSLINFIIYVASEMSFSFALCLENREQSAFTSNPELRMQR